MDLKVLKLLLLLSVVIVPAGCASTSDTSSDVVTPDLEPSPTHDDSHGWGANLQSAH